MADLDKRIALAERDGTLKRLHVDQHRMRKGLPAMTVQTSAGPLKAASVSITGHSTLVQGDKPLSCGAKVWLETTAALTAEWLI